MICRDIFFLCLMLVVAPAWIGTIWVRVLDIRGGMNRLLHAWVLGFVTVLAMTQLVLVPLVALEQTLAAAISVWKCSLQVLSLIAAVLLFCDKLVWAGIKIIKPKRWLKEKWSVWCMVLAPLVALLILMQAYIPAHYEHSDDDDSRFIAEQVSAVEHNSMYLESPIDADFMYWDQGEVRKDLTSPWAMYLAMLAKLGGIAPAVLSHTYLPFFFVLLCYAVYALLGEALLGDDREKRLLFLLFLSVLHLAGYTSTHTLASMLLLRIWQGKAMCASFMLPFLFYLFYRIMQKDCDRNWLGLLYAASIGACLLSGIGIVTASIMLLLYGAVDFCYYRKWRKTLAIWMAALPCAVFFGYYLM